MGLVTKNGILLVDFASRERRRGLTLNKALANVGVIRFRPIIMTTLAMIVGMIPLSAEAAPNVRQWRIPWLAASSAPRC